MDARPLVLVVVSADGKSCWSSPLLDHADLIRNGGSSSKLDDDSHTKFLDL
jgi:hypothetical protein